RYRGSHLVQHWHGFIDHNCTFNNPLIREPYSERSIPCSLAQYLYHDQGWRDHGSDTQKVVKKATEVLTMKVFWCIISTVLIFGAFQTVAIASDVQIGITVPEGRVTVERGPWFVGADLSVGKSFQTIVHTSVAIGRTIVRGSFAYT